MLDRIRNLLIGTPLPTHELAEKRLNKIRALAAFSPDALSSIAYANQEIFLGLAIAGAAGLRLSWPIGLGIAGLLLIVAISYNQTIHGYPSGGGSYVVARENLGIFAGLVAGSALLIDYLLTAAVSLTAGVDAIASAVPFLWPYRVELALFMLAIMTIANLRGLKETGTLMAVPVYLFLFTYIPMLAWGIFRLAVDGPGSLVVTAPTASQPLTTFLVLHAFATGCTALTGIEAISNGIPAFEKPETRNASRTLIVMAVLMGILFLGSIGLTQFLAVTPSGQETILSALAARLLGRGPTYFVIQVSTMLILAVAANTSFAGFPRLSAILAADGFLPRQLTGLGDRLVFANGILSLSFATAMLIIIFHGDTHALIPLFAVGVFLAFTLSQTGMVVHWQREGQPGWQWKAFFNGLGAIATLVTLLVVSVSKFIEGAWIILLLIPAGVLTFRRIHNHYRKVANELTLRGLPPDLKPPPKPRLVIPISGVHRGVVQAVTYALSLSDQVTAVYIELEPGASEKVRETWQRWFPDVRMEIVPSPYRSIVGPFLEFLDAEDLAHNDGQQATVVLPEFVPARWYQVMLHNQTAWLLKAALLYRRRQLGFQRAIIDVPYHLRR